MPYVDDGSRIPAGISREAPLAPVSSVEPLSSRPSPASDVMTQHGPRPVLSFRIGDQPVPGYRLVRELGRGTFGVVWLAITDNGFERALKIVNLEQKGGKKEFRALRLIKDRKILHGNLLMLVDYWLIDREGTILSTAMEPDLDSQVAPGRNSGPGAANKVKTDAAPQVQITNIAALNQGTMLPSLGEDSGPMSVRDTFQQNRISDTRHEENNNAIWLVVAMELGHKTLHDRQKEFTAEQRNKLPKRGVRRGPTQVDRRGDTSPGSNTISDGSRHQDEDEEEELLPLSADEVLPYMEQAARGLDHLHRNDIVHRDVKPQNIMLVGDVAKVCDYGLASELNDIRATTNAFTLPYAANEAINKHPTPASDQYSLAVTYVELRTGRWPFPSNTQTAVFACKDSGIHDLKCIRKRAVRLVLKKALAKNPRDRYPTCGDFVKELTKAERSRSNIFAIVQGTLAILAIMTVLMAAAATHPRVSQWLWERAIAIGWIKAPEERFDLKIYTENANTGIKQLRSGEFEAANDLYPNLDANLMHVPKSEIKTRVDVILGLARLSVSQANRSLSDNDRAKIQATLKRITTEEQRGMSDDQRLIQHYLQVVGDLSPTYQPLGKQYDPNSSLANGNLGTWELELWRARMPKSAQLLAEVVRLRKSGNSTDLQAARSKYAELLQSTYFNKLGPSEYARHEINLEGLHLDRFDSALTAGQRLSAINSYIEEVRGLHERLLVRAQLLKLLIIKEHQGGKISLFDDQVVTLVAGSERNIYTRATAQDHDFSDTEVELFHNLYTQFEEEIEQRNEPIAGGKPDLAYQALKNWFSNSECVRILSERLEQRLNMMPLEKSHLPVIAIAWNDLRQLVANEFTTQVPGTVVDLGIRTALISADADPEKSLAGFAALLRRSSEEGQLPAFKALLERAADPRWTEHAVKHLRDLVDNPPPGLAGKLDDPNPAQNLTKKLLALESANVITIDPADASALEARLDKLRGSPLTDLLRIELEWAKVTNGSASEAQLKDWQKQAEIITSSLGASEGEQADYARFVLAALQAAANYDLPTTSKEFVTEFFELKQPPRWLTKTRRLWAEGPLMVLAARELRLDGLGRQLDDDQVYRFLELSAIKEPELSTLRSDATRLGLNANCLNAIEAIRLAIEADQTKWAAVRSKLAGRETKYDKYLQRKRAGRLLQYVDCFARLHTSPVQAPVAHELVKQLDDLLHKSATGESPYFVFDAGPPDPSETVRTDEGLLQNFVDPMLAMLTSRSGPRSELPEEVAEALARLYAAKGRLLQRNPHMVVMNESFPQAKDTVTLTSTLANRAYWEAHQLDPKQIEYVAGYGRAIIYGLKDSEAAAMTELMEKHSPRAKESLGLQYLVARNDRLNSYSSGDRQLWLNAVKQLESLRDKVISTDDRWQLLELCYEELSDAHLRMAFWTKSVTVDEVKALEDDREPAPGTKAYHLYHAASYAHKQLEIENRLIPEYAHIALGNAYEDYAHYIRIPAYYEKSLAEFGEAIKSARKLNRETAYAQMNFGRCMYRFSIDPFARDSKDEVALQRQIELHKQAIDHLKEAFTDGELSTIKKAEARMWLAQNENERFKLRTSDPDFTSNPAASIGLLKSAVQHAGEGAALAASVGDTPVQFMLLRLQFITLLDLASRKDEHGLTTQELNAQLQLVEDTAFQSIQKATLPTGVSPDDVGVFAKFSGRRYVDSPPRIETNYPLRDRWLPTDGQLVNLWSSTPEWRFEEFLVRWSRVAELDRQAAAESSPPAMATTSATVARLNGELKKAKDLLPFLSSSGKIKAESHIADRLAKIANDKIATLNGLTQKQFRNALRGHLADFANAKKTRDRVIALDSETAAILARTQR
jgi:serine/threonine protein kinase